MNPKEQLNSKVQTWWKDNKHQDRKNTLEEILKVSDYDETLFIKPLEDSKKGKGAALGEKKVEPSSAPLNNLSFDITKLHNALNKPNVLNEIFSDKFMGPTKVNYQIFKTKNVWEKFKENFQKEIGYVPLVRQGGRMQLLEGNKKKRKLEQQGGRMQILEGNKKLKTEHNLTASTNKPTK